VRLNWFYVNIVATYVYIKKNSIHSSLGNNISDAFIENFKCLKLDLETKLRLKCLPADGADRRGEYKMNVSQKSKNAKNLSQRKEGAKEIQNRIFRMRE
jgi:hypothetical protein